MFKKLSALVITLGVVGMSQMAAADAVKQVEYFPAAEKGQVRQVILLPQLEDENSAKVELLVGQEVEVDCNRHFLMGNLEEKDLHGWGYTYWQLDEVKGIAGTLMACPDNAKTKQFVMVNNDALLRYNSKLPIVVYVPEGVQVKYRIWRADEAVQEAEVK